MTYVLLSKSGWFAIWDFSQTLYVVYLRPAHEKSMNNDH